jgi:hypothetical protein
MIGTHRGRLGGWGGILILLLAVGVGPVQAQTGPRLRTVVSADSVYIGERFTVSFVGEHAEGTELGFPDPSSNLDRFGAVEILERRAVTSRALGGGQRVDSVAYEVTTFALDSVRVPAVPVQVVAGGDTSFARTPPRGVAVVSVIGAESKGIHSVAPLAPFPRAWWAWVLAALVATMLLAGLAYLWWRRQEESEEAAPSVRPASEIDQTPYEAATTWIRQLESYDLSDPDAIKPFYVELSSALRVYLARELDVAALERTTREVVAALEDRADVPADAAGRLQAVLELADLVKFADARPDAADHEKAIAASRAALDAIETRPDSPTPAGVDGVASSAGS